MVITLEIYKEIRDRRNRGESQRKIAREMGISRNTVKKYWEGASVPWERQEYGTRLAPVMTNEVDQFIAQCLQEDVSAPRKQRHTAKRIHDRLQAEIGFTGGESTIRKAVSQAKNKHSEAFVPLEFPPGDAVQIDWGEATIYLKGEKILVNLFCTRLCYSATPIVFAYRRQNFESFLDALVRTMEYYGGVPRKIIFDNAKVAVKSGFGAQAIAQDNYAKLAAHYGFEPVFCNVASGNEKGLVEGLVGYIRRNTCVPMPKVENLDELNEIFREKCEEYLKHKIRGKGNSVGELFSMEKEALYPLPIYPYDVAKRATARVNPFSLVRFDTNSYSVPVKFTGKEVGMKAFPEKIEIYFQGKLIASHPRCLEKEQEIYLLEHYFPLLERKGRAIFYAKPVKFAHPKEFLSWLEAKKLKPKEIVDVLKQCCEVGFEEVMKKSDFSTTTDEILVKNEEKINKYPDNILRFDDILVEPPDLLAYDDLLHREEVRP